MDIPEVVIDLSMNAAQRHLARWRFQSSGFDVMPDPILPAPDVQRSRLFKGELNALVNHLHRPVRGMAPQSR